MLIGTKRNTALINLIITILHDLIKSVIPQNKKQNKEKNMSADNGIYILKARDQYRVAHLCAIDNVSWSIIDGNWQNKKETRWKCVPTRVVEMWGKCKYTRDENVAYRIAHKWANSLSICEYGVNVITYNKTWKHIIEDAKEYAKKEIDFIRNYGNVDNHNIELLKSISDGSFFIN